jgi:protein-L-isoaspartate(D-aspartate) O-methyltransferase
VVWVIYDMPIKHLIAWILFLLAYMPNGQTVADEYALQRQQMVTEIRDNVQLTAEFIKKESFEKRVMNSLNRVPRHEFVPKELRSKAYENRPLPIGFGQTLAQQLLPVTGCKSEH